jgi:hydroxymethylpyrimidine kinase/phosphomethylpyrimidine kinase
MTDVRTSLPIALTIAGLDPSGGAGVIADIRTFSALACASSVVVTSITFQNDQEVYGAEHLSPETISRQLAAVIGKRNIAAVKTGMLPTRDGVRELAKRFRDGTLAAPVIDPVIRSTSGFELVEPDAISEIIKLLFPLARLVTPNIPEAELITGLEIRDVEAMREAATAIRKLGARAVLIKGGHLTSSDHLEEALDLLDDEGEVTILSGRRIPNASVRGSGCMLSSAIAAGLAYGRSLEESVADAKRFVAQAIANAVVF